MQVQLGKTYMRRDGLSVIVYNFNHVSQRFHCVILTTNDFYDVNGDGRYLLSEQTANDLIKEL